MRNTKVIVALFCALALAAFGCRNESTDNTTTDTTTATSTSDTSMTTSTISTSGTETTGTTSTTSTGSSGGTISSLDPADKEFVVKAAQGGIAEVTLGQMASSKGTNADVKSFANRMVADHGAANEELKQLAQTKGMALPADTDPEHKGVIDRLGKATGKDFDKEYIKAMVNDHEKVVNAFQKASTDSKDPDLRAWVTKTLPTIQDHLKMAKETSPKLN